MEKLTRDELELLATILDEYGADLRMEIANTDDFNFKQSLKERSRKLQAIVSKLESARLPAVPV